MNNVFVKKVFIVCSVLLLSIFSSLFVSAQENQTNTTEMNVTTIETTNETSTNETVSNQTTTTEQEGNTSNTTEILINETEQNQTTVCEAAQCDVECLICSDASCQYPEVGCKESLSLVKVSPSSIKKGEQQLNIMVKNTGNVALSEVYAIISGYGIVTTETLSIAMLPAGEKDYTFTKINVETAGEFSIIIQIYSNNSLLLEEVSDLVVEEVEVQADEIEQEEEFNTTAASERLNITWIRYDAVESLYYEKEKEEYVLFGVEDELKQIKEHLRQAQIAIIELNSVEFQANIIRAETILETTKNEVEHAAQEKKSLSELFVENLTVIGSLLGVIISAVTVWSLTKAHLKNAKVVNIIKGKQIINVDKDTKVENIIQKEEEKKEQS